MTSKLLPVVIVVGFLLAGMGAGRFLDTVWPGLKLLIKGNPVLYQSPDVAFLAGLDSQDSHPITWEDLLAGTLPPANQNATPDNSKVSPKFHKNLKTRSEIAGFIVPLDYHPDKTPHQVFIVPYYGACLHFPPPPPEQMIYAQLAPGFAGLDLMQAYQLQGVLSVGFFEDELGTSAYKMQVARIRKYAEHPDDVRSH